MGDDDGGPTGPGDDYAVFQATDPIDLEQAIHNYEASFQELQNNRQMNW